MAVEKQIRGKALPYLRAWRQSKGLSQRELGESSGVQYSQISRIERQGQHVTPQTIKRLAEALGISREALINHDPEAQKEPGNDANVPRPTRPRAVSTNNAVSAQKA